MGEKYSSRLATTDMEFDLAWQEIFSLSIGVRFSQPCCLSTNAAEFRVFIALLEQVWPELLQEPINPGDKPIKRRLNQAARRVKKQSKIGSFVFVLY